MSGSVRPIDLPELRRDTVLFQAERASLFVENMAQRLTSSKEEREVAVATLTTSLATAELFWVSSEMGELARAAGASLPSFAIKPHDLPSPNGLIVLNSPWVLDEGLPIRGIAWLDSPTTGGLTLTVYLDRELSWERTRGESAPAGAPPMFWASESITALPYGDTGWADLNASLPVERILPSLLAIWLLMRQPVVQVDEVELDRFTKKRLKRSGCEARPVRVIELHRPKGAGGESGSGNYHHQWMVRGHWRNHWYPKLQVHRPVWIAPHIKGPEGAPILGGEKVYAWKQ